MPQPGPDSIQAKEIAARHGGQLTGFGPEPGHRTRIQEPRADCPTLSVVLASAS